MSDFVISFMFALGAGAWIYSKVMRTTGSQVKPSLMVSGTAGVLIFVVLFYLLSTILHK
ncbi:MAG: hypothetical protein WCG30_00455 [Candidatus Saccharibacteria bacterium]|jgi:predicted ABC-type exoprotein transport system permease subunit